jgi:hypothetical protein
MRHNNIVLAAMGLNPITIASKVGCTNGTTLDVQVKQNSMTPELVLTLLKLQILTTILK